MIKLSMKGGGIMKAVLGKRPHPFLLKNSVTHSSVSKRSVFDGGGSCGSFRLGKVGKVGRDGNFSVNFIGSGFCDG